MLTKEELREANLPAVAARVAGIYAIIAGATTLVGWAFDIEGLTDWTNEGISMFPNTAVCCCAAGVALLLLAGASFQFSVFNVQQRSAAPAAVPSSSPLSPVTSPLPRAAARACGGLLLLVGALTLFEHATGRNLGIDTLLFDPPAWGQTAAAAPMRMGPPASGSFLAMGTAIILATLGTKARFAATIVSIFTLAVAMLSLTGYLFGADQLFGVAKYSGIALNTSTVIAALSFGLMAAVPEHGLAAALLRDDAGGRVHRRLILPVILLPLLLGWLRLIGEQAGLYDAAFGTALRSLTEVVLFFGLLWWTASNISWHAAQAEKAHARLGAIIESSEDAIVSKSLEGFIETWNAGATRVFGYTSEEAVGQHVTMLIPTELRHEETEILRRLRNGERIEHYETVRRRKDGTDIKVSLTISPIRQADGKIVAASKIARDITARSEMEDERSLLLERERAARNEAERASQLKDEFLATLSHELRTPLNAILGWSQLLSADSSRDDLEQGLEVIRRNSNAQTQLIEDLLDMSRIISGKVRLDVQVIDLLGVIEAALETVAPAAEAKQIQIRRVLSPAAGSVSGDAIRLQQVFWNLLANAIKFTPKGGKVEVSLEHVDEHVEFAVRDNGIGISADVLPVVFERFRQADASTTRSYGGLGLGLAIVKHLVELHGGTVRAESEGEGKGAAFFVSLPLAPVRISESRALTTTPLAFDAGGIDLAGVKVLVVDDEPDARGLIERVLKRCGASVHAASSAEEGLVVLRTFLPQVLVSDIGMPETDGYDFIRAVRSLSIDEGGATPAIALTAFARSEDRTRAMLAGYQVHVAKPIEPQELAVTVRSLTARGR